MHIWRIAFYFTLKSSGVFCTPQGDGVWILGFSCQKEQAGEKSADTPVHAEGDHFRAACSAYQVQPMSSGVTATVGKA